MKRITRKQVLKAAAAGSVLAAFPIGISALSRPARAEEVMREEVENWTLFNASTKNYSWASDGAVAEFTKGISRANLELQLGSGVRVTKLEVTGRSKKKPNETRSCSPDWQVKYREKLSDGGFGAAILVENRDFPDDWNMRKSIISGLDIPGNAKLIINGKCGRRIQEFDFVDIFHKTSDPQPTVLAMGVSSGGFNWPGPEATGLKAANSDANFRHDIYNWFQPLEIANPRSYYDLVSDEGATPMTTIQVTDGGNLDAVLNGRYDSVLDEYAREIAAHNGTVIVRPLHEMNGNWYSWSVATGNNTPAKYQQAFRYIHDRVQAITNNVEWVFCPNVKGGWTGGQTSFESMFPGTGYVDWLGLDGYNFAFARGNQWESFESIFRSSYDELIQLSNTPVMIAETSSIEDPNQASRKAQWITEAYGNSMDRIKAIVFFHIDRTQEEGVNFRFDTSSEALAAYRQVVS